MRGHAAGPKYLVPVLGEPFAHHQLRLLAAQGVGEVVLVLGHGGDEIRGAVGDSAFGVGVTYVDEGGWKLSENSATAVLAAFS